jgi:hypothetical protein
VAGGTRFGDRQELATPVSVSSPDAERGEERRGDESRDERDAGALFREEAGAAERLRRARLTTYFPLP